MLMADIDPSGRMGQRLAQIRVMCTMTFPDDPELRARAEITYWALFADQFSRRRSQYQATSSIQSSFIGTELVSNQLPEATASDDETTARFLAHLLAPFRGSHEAISRLVDSPSVDELNRIWAARWWDIFFTGKLLSLIGSIHQYRPKSGTSLNKAIFILRETDPNYPIRGVRQACESNLNKAWSKFRAVAHLCMAYFRTESDYYKQELASRLSEIFG